MEFLIVLVALCIVVLMVSSPLRRARMSERSGSEVADLEAAREAKYREIRDAELDYRTGKLSDEDYQAVDRALRAQAMEILRALDRARDN